jgi:hypothetical protein
VETTRILSPVRTLPLTTRTGETTHARGPWNRAPGTASRGPAGPAALNEAISKSGLPMIDVGDDRKIAYGPHESGPRSLPRQTLSGRGIIRVSAFLLPIFPVRTMRFLAASVMAVLQHCASTEISFALVGMHFQTRGFRVPLFDRSRATAGRRKLRPGTGIPRARCSPGFGWGDAPNQLRRNGDRVPRVSPRSGWSQGLHRARPSRSPVCRSFNTIGCT